MKIWTTRDPEFDRFYGGENSRFLGSDADGPAYIAACTTVSDVRTAVEHFVSRGIRPTVRSGGHCYENFVYANPKGAVIDLRSLSAVTKRPGRAGFCIEAGAQLGKVYSDLYNLAKVTIPGGSCGSVGVGGHISGGGYGLLSRLYGLTCDWVSAVDIVIVDQAGKTVELHIDRNKDTSLFRACRGGGGGSFGVITRYYFDRLPPAPREVMIGYLEFDWDGMSRERFTKVLQIYSGYWADRGKERDTWGLFTILNLSHYTSKRMRISFQFCDQQGTCDKTDVIEEFASIFNSCSTHSSSTISKVAERACLWYSESFSRGINATQSSEMQLPWIQSILASGSNGPRRRKYKSAYMRDRFSDAEAECLYKHLRTPIEGVDLSEFSILVDSYGGSINLPQLEAETAISQRSSIMKLQFISTWSKAAQDEKQLKWLDQFYTNLYSLGANAAYGVPYPGDRYQGCYINYPDVDMLRYSFWPALYFGFGLYPYLQEVKSKYDPHNIFHHAMSIRVA